MSRTKKSGVDRAIPFPVKWSESQIAAPNVCLRSALFGSTRGPRQRFLEDTVLASLGGYMVTVKGERFDQFDFDVWAAALHHQNEFGFGVTSPISVSGLAKSAGLDGSGKSLKRVRKSLRRMLDSTVVLKFPGGGFAGHLISSFAWRDANEDGDDGEGDAEYVLKLDPDVAKLLGRDQYTLIDALDRRCLGENFLAKWLHGFICSHASMHPTKVETLHALCGSQAAELRYFRANVREALELLKENGLITDWQIDARDCVVIQRKPSPTQQRHLERGHPVA